MDSETVGAVALNVAVYISLGMALLQLSRQRIPSPPDARGAFMLLGSGLRRAFPDLPQGFTLREGLYRARLAGLDVRWDEIDRTLADYEAHRYGGGPAPGLPQSELMRLVKVLWRRR